MSNKLRKRYIDSDYERLHTRLVKEDSCETELDSVIDARTGCIYDTKTITSGSIREVEIFPIYLKHTRLVKEDSCETELDSVIDARTGCIYDTKTITSGSIREVEIFPIYLKKDMPDEWRRKQTKEAQRNLNSKNAVKNFMRKMNTNFNKDDYLLVLNYFDELRPKDHDEAKRHMRNFIRILNKKYEKEQLKNGVPKDDYLLVLNYFDELRPKDHDEAKRHMRNFIRILNKKYEKEQLKNGVPKSKIKKIKYMYVTEYSDEKKIKCHHHFIMNAVLPISLVKRCWKYGNRGKMDFLDPDDMHLTGLANYLSKDPRGKKRWCCSKNLKEPRVTRNLSMSSKKKVKKMTANQNLIKYEMEKNNPGYIFVDAQVYINEPRVTRNLSMSSKKKVKKMTANQNLIKYEMEKNNPGYIFVDAQVYINNYNGMPYIYARMRKLDKGGILYENGDRKKGIRS